MDAPFHSVASYASNVKSKIYAAELIETFKEYMANFKARKFFLMLSEPKIIDEYR